MGNIQNSSGLSLPISVYAELEREYEQAVRRGDSKINIYKRLEKLYTIQSLQQNRTLPFQSYSRPTTPLVLSKTQYYPTLVSEISHRMDNSLDLRNTYREYEENFSTEQNLNMSPFQIKKPSYSNFSKVSPTSPTISPSSRSKLRPRPKSANNSNPNSIDRSKRSGSPRRSQLVDPVLKMSFESLWNICWISVSSRLNLDPLPIADYPNINSYPTIESNVELVLLIYLLRSLTREFE